MNVTRCRNCDQPVQANTVTCLWCGTATGAAPSVPLTTLPPPTPAPATATVPAAAGTPIPHATSALGPAFRGWPAGVGAQVAAFSIDAVAIGAIIAVVHMATGSALLAAVILVEALVFLWVWEARTGLTVGNAVLRIRTSRAQEPWSPGIGRVLVRAAITGAGVACLVVGGWLLAASGTWDKSGGRRTLTARATGTRAVTVPRSHSARTAALTPVHHQPVTSSHLSQPGESTGSGTAEPRLQPPSLEPLPPSPSPAVATQSMTTAPSAPPPGPSPTAAPPSASAAAAAPQSPAQTDHPAAGGGVLLLVFDSGQRETVQLPAAVNLGRRPSRTEPSDHLINVADADGTVSKTHLRLEHSRGRNWITDLGSTNGTDLLEDDGTVTAVAPHVRTLVEDGVRVRMHRRSFTISVVVDGPTSPESTP